MKKKWTSADLVKNDLFLKDTQTNLLTLVKSVKHTKKLVKKVVNSIPKLSNEALLYRFENDLSNVYADYVKEHLAIKGRKFRLDYAVPCVKIGFEIHGGQFMVRKGKNGSLIVGGRHNSGNGYEKDLEKMNLHTLNEWLVFQFTYQQLVRGDYFESLVFLANKLEKQLKNG